MKRVRYCFSRFPEVEDQVIGKIILTNMFPLPKLFKGWLIFVPPIDPTKTICLTPAALAVSNHDMISAFETRENDVKKKEQSNHSPVSI